MLRALLTVSLMAALWAVLLPSCDTDDDDAAGDSDSDGDSDGDTDWDSQWAAWEEEVLTLTNERRAQGADCGTEGTFGPAPALTMQSQLREAARLHSLDMGERDFFDHDSPGGPNGDTMQDRIENAGYTSWSYIGENIAAGQASPQEVVQAWMDSDGHCSNIMSPNFEEIGVGYAYVESNQYKHFWTQDFGTSF